MSENKETSDKPLKTFFCQNDVHDPYVFQGDDYFLHDDIDMAKCPLCEAAVKEVSWRYMNLAKAWRNSTGPGDTSRSRLNRWKHGGASKSFPLLAPALTGKFPECVDCEYKTPCKDKPFKYCPVQVGPIMRILQAFEEGDVDMMKQFAGITHARMAMVMKMMYQQILDKGVMMAKVKKTQKGDTQVTEFLGWEANPLLTQFLKFAEARGHTAEQQMMTPENKTYDETMQGFLQGESEKSADLKALEEKRVKAMVDLKTQLRKAQMQRGADPALKEYNKMKPEGPEKVEFEEVKDYPDKNVAIPGNKSG